MKALVALVLAVTITACGQESTSPSASAEAFDIPADNVLLGGEMQMLSRGVVTAVLSTDTAYMYEDDRPMDLMGVKVTFFTDQGVPAGELTSQGGQYDMGNGVFVARGGVVLITQGDKGDRRLETEELHYNLRDDELWSEVPFSMVEAGQTSTGTSFRTDSKFQIWQVTGGRTEGAVAGEGGIQF